MTPFPAQIVSLVYLFLIVVEQASYAGFIYKNYFSSESEKKWMNHID